MIIAKIPQRNTYNFTGRAHDLIYSGLVWQNEGIATVPVQPRGKACLLPWRKYESSPPPRQLLYKWFGNGVMNLAVICGSGNLLALDFDSVENYQSWRTKASRLAETYTEITARGVHAFFIVDVPISKRFAECEALGAGHLCVVAPSVHETGHVYRPVDAGAPIIRTKTDDIFSILSDLPDVKPTRTNGTATKPIPQDRDDLIGKIKQRFPLSAYASTLTDLSPSGSGGRYFIGRCPLHDDDHPSFWVDAERDIWGCFAGCNGGKPGDLLNLYSLVNRCSIAETIKQLAGDL